MSLTVTGKVRLVSDVRRGRTGAGKPWANAAVRVINYRKAEGGGWEEASSYSASVVAFEDTARALVAFAKGDEVEIRGRIREVGVWQPKTGDPRAQLSIALDEVTAPVKRPRADRDEDSRRGRQESGGGEQGNRRDIATVDAVDRQWPKPAVPGQGGLHQPLTGAAPRGPGATITNLRDHTAQRGARGQGRTTTGRPA